MNRIGKLAARTLGLGLLALTVAAGNATAEPVGFVAAFVGNVEIQAGGATSWAAAALDQDVSIGDLVRTGDASAIKILLADDTILSIGESSELVVDSLLVGAAATRDPSVLRLLKGRARVLVGEAFGGPTRLEMHTPTAVIGVKGTEFETYIVEDPFTGLWTLVCDVDGTIFVKHIDPDLQRKIVEPNDGLCTRVFGDRPPEDEVPRPAGFAPVQVLTSKPAPGLAENVLFGAPGVGANQPSGNVDPWVVAPGPEGGPSELPTGGDVPEGYFEDVVQTQTVSNNTIPGSGDGPLPASIPLPPSGNPEPPIGGGLPPSGNPEP
ncbi:MAG: FecR family protein [Myxococcota bacterium]